MTQSKGFKLFQKKEEKPMTKNQKIVKTVFDWFFNCICLALVIFALLLAIASIGRTSDKSQLGISHLGNLTYAPVASDSMAPTFKKGDLVVGKLFKGDESILKEGLVITFRTVAGGGVQILNTHRIFNIIYTDSTNTKINYIRTKGDAYTDADASLVFVKDIVSTWGTSTSNGMLYKGLGSPVIWVQESSTNFFLGVVLPIIILFAIYAFIFIRVLIIAAIDKRKSMPVTADSLSEEDKKRLAEEYLASLKTQMLQSDENSAQNANADDTTLSDNSTTDNSSAETNEKENK